MNRMFSAVAGAVMIAGACAISAAEQLQEVTVQATRVMKTSVGRTATGVPIMDTTLSYGVSYADLNLSSHADVLLLQKRVKDAAQKACKELADLNPLIEGQPGESECTKRAADKGLARVEELAAAAAH